MHYFWSKFSPAQCLPNSCNCEFISSEIIAQPFSFWSSLIYVCVGLLFIRKNQNSTLWSLALITLGFSSMFAHGSFREIALSMDFASIILILTFSSVIDFKLLTTLKRKFAFLFTQYIMLVWLFFKMDKWPKIGLSFLVFIIALSELINKRRVIKPNRDFYKSIILVSFSFILFMVDELKILCDPHGVIHGHTIWHLGSGLSLFYFGRWRLSQR